MDINDRMEHYLKTKKYIPTREYYNEVKAESGFFTNDQAMKTEQPEAAQALRLMVKDVVEMDELIKNNFLQSEVKKQEFFMNNPVQQTLRRQVEEQQKEIQALKEKNSKLMSEQNDKENNNEAEMQRVIKRLEYELSGAKAQNDNNDKATKAMKDKNNELTKLKNKLEGTISKLEGIILPKVERAVAMAKEIDSKL